MRARNQQSRGWDDERYDDELDAFDSEEYEEPYGSSEYDAAYDDDGWYPDEEERGLVLQTDQSLVGISSTVTRHGVPLLSYSHTMNRFYKSRKQRLSLGRYRCEVCGERIRFWAWETSNGSRTHDGCYERLAWTWTNLYAQQQRLAAQDRFE